MAATRSGSRGRRFVTTVHKPHGVIQPRVQKVGPEHFGIVNVDCAKARFKWMLCDFYGTVFVQVTFGEFWNCAATCCVLPGAELFFGSRAEFAGPARVAVERAAEVLEYDLRQG